MMMSWITTFTVSFAVLALLTNADDPCRFQDTKGIIDLTTLGKTDGKPAYPDKAPTTGSNYKYSYNPCKPFSEGATCVNVAACQVSNDALYTFIIAKHDSVTWSSGAGLGSLPSITYSYMDKKTVVQLQCGIESDNLLEALGEESTNNYKFRLTHKCACWNGCSGPSPPSTTKSSGGVPNGRIGGGAVFIIILFVLVFVYFVGFALFYRFRMDRSGTELIAHRTFWVALPGYAKDGAIHVYRKVANKGDTPYQSV